MPWPPRPGGPATPGSKGSPPIRFLTPEDVPLPGDFSGVFFPRYVDYFAKVFIIEFRLRKGGFFHAEKTEGITQTHCKNGCPDVPESCPDPRSAEKAGRLLAGLQLFGRLPAVPAGQPPAQGASGTGPHQKENRRPLGHRPWPELHLYTPQPRHRPVRPEHDLPAPAPATAATPW